LSNIRKLAKYIYRSLSYATAMDFSIVIWSIWVLTS
jgi:hypothetical protein